MRTTKRCAADRAGPPEASRGFPRIRAISLSPVPPGGTRHTGFGLGCRIKFKPNPAKKEALGSDYEENGPPASKRGAGGRLELL